MSGKNKEKLLIELDKEIIHKIRELSLKEGLSISDIINNALVKYTANEDLPIELREKAVVQFCSKPFRLNLKEIDELLSEDYFAQ